jgi:hypothetical protein
MIYIKVLVLAALATIAVTLLMNKLLESKKVSRRVLGIVIMFIAPVILVMVCFSAIKHYQ